SASSAGTAEEPWPRTPGPRSSPASASPSARPAAATSSAAAPGCTSSERSSDAYSASSEIRWSRTGRPVGIDDCRRPLPAARTRRRGVSGPSAVDAFNPSPERAQPLVDPLVAAVDLADVADRGRALGAQARDEHGHPRADVRALHALPVQLRGAGDDDAV